MNQQLSTAIDFYLQTDKINPFFQHLTGNASSSELIQLRNSAYILNKLSLLNLEHSSPHHNQNSFEQSHLQLYAVTLDSIINNSSMPYKDFQSVRDLVRCIQHYHWLLTKLTFTEDGKDQKTRTILKKVSLNSFWPRIRALMIGVEQKIPTSHQYIKEYVIIRRGLLETDKKYFISQMMAKKIQTNQLKWLIAKYQNQESIIIDQHIQAKKKQEDSQEIPNFEEKSNNSKEIVEDWKKVKMCVRMLPLTNQLSDWKILLQYLQSEKYQNETSENDKKNINQYVSDIFEDLKNKQEHSNEAKKIANDKPHKSSYENERPLKWDMNAQQKKLKQKISEIIQANKRILDM